jgi:predicted dehydrogenase
MVCQITTRRKFLIATSALAGFQILPSGLLANSPNGKLCTAHIGVGGKGSVDTSSIAADSRTQVIGLCDVDKNRLDGKGKRGLSAKFPDALKFRDYREMLSALGDKVDALSISTPDHTHYPATLAAMGLGKHVYTQKPLTNNLSEARHLMETARAKDVVTQMGIQNKSTYGYRMSKRFIQDGIIGKVSKVYVWSYKDWGYDGAPYTGEDPVPAYLDWNLWLGTAPEHAFLEGKYHPGNWRRIIDFGCGTLGDMGVHIFDTPFDALALKAPKWVMAEAREPNHFSLPTKCKVSYGFEPTQYTTKDFQWTWYDGQYSPPSGSPDLKLPEGEEFPNQGAMFVGEKGRMLLPHIAGPRFFPKSIYETLKKGDIPQRVNHYTQWIDAIFGSGEKPSANFDYAAPMSETVLLGVVANQHPGQKLEWDSCQARFPNFPEAEKFVKREYRKF